MLLNSPCQTAFQCEKCEKKISLSAKTPDVALSAITEFENMFEKSEDQFFDTELTDKLKNEGIYDAMLSQLKNQGISINSTEPRSEIVKIHYHYWRSSKKTMILLK